MPISATSKPRILLLSGYDAASHRYWRNSLVNGLEEFDWTEIALPDRYFSWRVRGNSLTFAFQHKEILARSYDCLIATSMVDLASLRGFVPQLAEIPNILYFHENQFDYPAAGSASAKTTAQNTVNAQLTSIYALLCADNVLFNSKYNQRTFFNGAENLLEKLPDGIPNKLLTAIKQKSQVLPVAISASSIVASKKSNHRDKFSSDHPLQIVWNHRWEYDKQPEVFFDAMILLKQQGFPFRLNVLGQSFRQKPSCFHDAEQLLKDEIQTWGFQPKQDYYRILAEADIVISTARHDFQGLSMLEAIYSGCIPVAPNRVAYPEYIQDNNLYQVGDNIDEAQSLYQKLLAICKTESVFESQKESVVAYLDSHLLKAYRQTILASIKQYNYRVPR